MRPGFIMRRTKHPHAEDQQHDEKAFHDDILSGRVYWLFSFYCGKTREKPMVNYVQALCLQQREERKCMSSDYVKDLVDHKLRVAGYMQIVANELFRRAIMHDH